MRRLSTSATGKACDSEYVMTSVWSTQPPALRPGTQTESKSTPSSLSGGRVRCCIGHVLHFRVKPSHLLRKLSATHATSSLVLDVRLLKPAAGIRPLRFFRRHVPHLHSPPFRDASTQTPLPHSTDGRSGDQSPTRTPALLPSQLRSGRLLAPHRCRPGVPRAGTPGRPPADGANFPHTNPTRTGQSMYT